MNNNKKINYLVFVNSYSCISIKIRFSKNISSEKYISTHLLRMAEAARMVGYFWNSVSSFSLLRLPNGLLASVLVFSCSTNVFTMVRCYWSYFGHQIVDGGERAVIFDRFRGVLPKTIGEGTHFRIPFIQVILESWLWFLVSLQVRYPYYPSWNFYRDWYQGSPDRWYFSQSFDPSWLGTLAKDPQRGRSWFPRPCPSFLG